jgi:DnaK suppressor protein
MDELGLAGARDLAIETLSKRFTQLRLVEAALDRVTDGTYGLCLRCDEEIGTKRLAALPNAGLCITCQQDEDDERINEAGYRNGSDLRQPAKASYS